MSSLDGGLPPWGYLLHPRGGSELRRYRSQSRSSFKGIAVNGRFLRMADLKSEMGVLRCATERQSRDGWYL
jgi:hypothetical protein